MYQVLIMAECLIHPIKDQENKIKLTSSHKNQVISLQTKASQMLAQIDKVKPPSTFKTSTALRSIFKRETIWSLSKKNLKTPQTNLKNFQIAPRKREIKN